MRVCHVIESAATGSASVMLTLVERGVAAGQDVTVIYSPIRASAEFFERARKIAHARFIPLAMHRSVGRHDLHAWMKLHSILRRERFDVVHSHSSKAGALARLGGIGGHSAQIYTPHGFVTMTAQTRRTYAVMERFLARFCDAIVAVSRRENDHGKSLGIAEAKIVTIPNGIENDLPANFCDVDAFDPMADRQQFTVGFVGRFSDQKNPILTLEAFRRLIDVRPDSRLIMIGDGELSDTVATKIAALDLAANVDLPGACSALPFYPRLDVLLCSSQFEAMSLTFLEALNHGVPIVSTDVGGVDELIDAGKTGFICASSADALGAALIALATHDPADRMLMRKRSLALGRQFNAKIMFDQTVELYSKSLEQRRKSRSKRRFLALVVARGNTQLEHQRDQATQSQ